MIYDLLLILKVALSVPSFFNLTPWSVKDSFLSRRGILGEVVCDETKSDRSSSTPSKLILIGD